MPVFGKFAPQKNLRNAVAYTVLTLALLVGPCLSPCQAQSPLGPAGGFSPLVWFPRMRGELRISPIAIGISSGKNTLVGANQSWDLKNTFNMLMTPVFLDIKGRISVGPVGFRVESEPRDFVGETNFNNLPHNPVAEARFEFSGVRLGVDWDILRRYNARAGFNLDYYAFTPLFSESIRTDGGGKKITSDSPVTWGAHAAYTAPVQLYDLWPVFEIKASWPLRAATHTDVTDLEIAFGVRGAATVLGSLALRGGYRYTRIEFKDRQIFNFGTITTTSSFDATLTGWFGELAYYY